jgi:hypothetical protein
MEPEKKSIIEDRIKLLHEAIRDGQATIFNIDWKARTLLMVNSITVPIMLGTISLYSIKKDVFSSITLQNPVALLLFIVSILLLFALASVFYFTLKVIYPRIKFENINYPEELALIKDLDVFFPKLRRGKASFGEYKKKLESIENRETIELILLSELLSISQIRDDKTRTLNEGRIALVINAVLMLMGIFLFLLLLL